MFSLTALVRQPILETINKGSSGSNFDSDRAKMDEFTTSMWRYIYSNTAKQIAYYEGKAPALHLQHDLSIFACYLKSE